MSYGRERGEKNNQESWSCFLFLKIFFHFDFIEKKNAIGKNRSQNRAVQPIISIDVLSVKQDQTNEIE